MSNETISPLPQPAEIDFTQHFEMAAMSDYFTSYGQGASLTDIKLTDLYNYLRNPYANIKQIRTSSKYLTNKNGILREVIRAFKSLPTLDHTVSFSGTSDEKKIKKYEKKVNDFLEEIDVVEFVKDGMQEVAELGTVILCLRNNRYVQFMDLDDVRVIKNRNGKWIVEFDLSTIKSTPGYNTAAIIETLPDDITPAKYNLYKSKGEDYRYVELKNCNVVNLDAPRNTPFGLPLTLGAWGSVLQKEMINRVERSVADRLVKQVFILKAGYIDKDSTKLVPTQTIQQYFKEISKVLTKKEGKHGASDQDSAGAGLISLLQGLDLKALDVNTDMFKKELYEKIDADIHASLGVSASLIHGSGGAGSFSSAELNSQKFMSTIYDTIRKFEKVINGYINNMLPKDVTCKFKFSKTTIFDKQKRIEQYKELYMQMGIAKYYIEELTSLPYEDVIRQAKYEKEELKIQDYIYPAQNAFTQSGKDNNGAGREPVENPTNPNTIKSKGSGSNNVPKPSDSK